MNILEPLPLSRSDLEEAYDDGFGDGLETGYRATLTLIDRCIEKCRDGREVRAGDLHDLRQKLQKLLRQADA